MYWFVFCWNDAVPATRRKPWCLQTRIFLASGCVEVNVNWSWYCMSSVGGGSGPVFHSLPLHVSPCAPGHSKHKRRGKALGSQGTRSNVLVEGGPRGRNNLPRGESMGMCVPSVCSSLHPSVCFSEQGAAEACDASWRLNREGQALPSVCFLLVKENHMTEIHLSGMNKQTYPFHSCLWRWHWIENTYTDRNVQITAAEQTVATNMYKEFNLLEIQLSGRVFA